MPATNKLTTACLSLEKTAFLYQSRQAPPPLTIIYDFCQLDHGASGGALACLAEKIRTLDLTPPL
jgi:hypothetical protein